MSEQTEALERLEAAQRRHTYLGQTNTVGLSPEVRVRLDRDYRDAQQELSAAFLAYEDSLRRLPKGDGQ